MTDQPFEPNPSPGETPGQFSQRIRHQQVSARVPEEVARGVFATGALVLNGPHEFIIDFLQSITRPHQVVARIVLPTTIMQSMVRAMQQNLDNYTRRFGPIPELPNPQAMNAAGGQQAGAQLQPGQPQQPQQQPQQPEAGGGGGAEQQQLGAADEAGGLGATAQPGPGSTEAGGPDAAAGAGQFAHGGAAQQPPAPSVEEIYNQLKLPEDVATGAYANTVMITHSPAEFCFDFITSFYPRSTVAARIFMAASQVPRVHATLTRSFEQFKQKVIEQRRRAQQQPPQGGDAGDLRGGDSPEARD